MMVLAAGLLSGCAHYSPAPLAREPGLAPALAAVPDVPPTPLTVDRIVALAVRHDPDLVAARAKRGVAAAQIVRRAFFPTPPSRERSCR